MALRRFTYELAALTNLMLATRDCLFADLHSKAPWWVSIADDSTGLLGPPLICIGVDLFAYGRPMHALLLSNCFKTTVMYLRIHSPFGRLIVSAELYDS